MLPALTQPAPEHSAKEIAHWRTFTDRPFGSILTIQPSANPPPYEVCRDAAIDFGVTVLRIVLMAALSGIGTCVE
ncbi:hypothetical protein [Noviherbaspirillum sedimenti]